MASVETIFLINFLLNIAIAVSGIIVAMLIPGTKKIKAGEAGTSLGASWIPIALVIMILVSIAVFPLSFMALEGRNLYFALVLDVIAIGVTLLAFRELISARKAYRELEEEGVVEEVGVVETAPSPEAYRQQPVQVPGRQPYQTQVQLMTVECPQCGNHIQLAEGSHMITCPYCGLSGTI